MQPIPEDYEPPENETFPDGEAETNRISWFTLNDDQQPILVVQGDKMVARCRLNLDDAEGPPMSVTLPQVTLLAHAYGVTVAQLPPRPALSEPELVTEYLQIAANFIETADKTVKVKVSNGWVNAQKGSFPTFAVPDGMFYFKLVDLNPKKDGVPEHRASKNASWGDWFIAVFEVFAGEGGTPTPFVGCTFDQFMTYAVQVVQGPGGQPMPDWARTQKGEWTSHAKTISRIMMYSAPSLFSGDIPTFNDVHNLLPDWLTAAQSDAVMLKGYRAKTDKGVDLSWSTVAQATAVAPAVAAEVPEPVVPPPTNVAPTVSAPVVAAPVVAAPTVAAPVVVAPAVETAPVEDTPPWNPDTEEVRLQALEIFKKQMTVLANAPAFVAGTIQPTAEGVGALRKYITPLKAQGVAAHGVLAQLSYEEVEAILTQTKADSGLLDELTALRQPPAQDNGSDF